MRAEDPPKAATRYVDSDAYIREAWKHYVAAEENPLENEGASRAAIAVIDQMLADHPDWIARAKKQNAQLKNSDDPFPLSNRDQLSPGDMAPLFARYWALYDVGTGEFIRAVSYVRLREIESRRGNEKAAQAMEREARASSQRLVNDYFYCQTYDPGGWFWQPAKSVQEYVDFYF